MKLVLSGSQQSLSYWRRGFPNTHTGNPGKDSDWLYMRTPEPIPGLTQDDVVPVWWWPPLWLGHTLKPVAGGESLFLEGGREGSVYVWGRQESSLQSTTVNRKPSSPSLLFQGQVVLLLDWASAGWSSPTGTCASRAQTILNQPKWPSWKTLTLSLTRLLASKPYGICMFSLSKSIEKT